MSADRLFYLARATGQDLPSLLSFDETEITRYRPHPRTLAMRKRKRELEKLAGKYGYVVELGNGGHYKLKREGYPLITAAASPRNKGMWLRQTERLLKQATSRQ